MKKHAMLASLLLGACSSPSGKQASQESEALVQNAIQPQAPRERIVPADERRIAVPSNPSVQYWLVSERKTGSGHFEIVTRQVNGAGTKFVRQEVNCRTAGIGSGVEAPTLEALQLKPNPPEDPRVPAQGSANGILVAEACDM